MPRYGHPDYDPDFDDSPPPTPKYQAPPPPRWRAWYYTIRRHRTLILFSIFFFSTLRFFQNQRRPIFTPQHSPTLRYKNVDWRLYAYSQYATDTHYLCNSVMLFDTLDRLGSRAERILLYPEKMDLEVSDSYDRDSQLLVKARDEYGAHLIPTTLEAIRNDNWDDPNVKSDIELSNTMSFDMSISKFLAFNQTRYARILHIDSDVTILKNMDELFLLPSARTAMARSYWQEGAQPSALSPHVLLLEPSPTELQRLLDAAEAETRRNVDYDQELVNTRYRDSALVLPHRSYGLVTSEFRRHNHTAYHGNDYEVWSPERALAEASLIRFEDAPLPKPWIMWQTEMVAELQPRCDQMADSNRVGCKNRELWLNLYRTFRKRRKEICGLLSVPAPPMPDQEVPEKDGED